MVALHLCVLCASAVNCFSLRPQATVLSVLAENRISDSCARSMNPEQHIAATVLARVSRPPVYALY